MEHRKDSIKKRVKKREHITKHVAKKEGSRKNTNPNTVPPEAQIVVSHHITKKKVKIIDDTEHERQVKTTEVVNTSNLVVARRIKSTNISIEGLVGSEQGDEDEEDDYVGPQPPPYWEEKLIENKSVIKGLKHVENIGEALDDNPDLLTYVFKHPKFGRRISQDPKIAHAIIEHPMDFKKIAHRGSMKKSSNRKHHVIYLGHKYHFDDFQIHLEDRSKIITRSQLSLEKDREILDGDHILKALLGVERVYLKHDEIVYEGFLVFCDRKMHRYFFQDVNGKTIYHIRDYQFFTRDCLRRFNYGVLDQEGNEILRMIKRGTLTGKQLVDVYSPPKNFIGSIQQSFGCATPSFWLKNTDNHEFMEVRCCGRDLRSYWDRTDHAFEFIIKVVSTQHDMGIISTMWFEKQMETYSFAPFYGIHWNDDLTLNVKGLLLSTMLLVYLTYYKGRLGKRLYIERYKAPPRPSFSIFEEDLEDYEESPNENPQVENELTKSETTGQTNLVETHQDKGIEQNRGRRTSIVKS